MTGRFANSTTVTRDELCRAGLILNHPPHWPHLSSGKQLSADELERRGFYAAAHARRNDDDGVYDLDGNYYRS
jgi:hypothetical protein